MAKLLAEKLKKVVDKLVNKNQMTLIKGRRIMDVALIASECILRLKDERCECRINFVN